MTRVATDIGGTFTDIVWVDESTGEVRSDKSPTTPSDVVKGVINAYNRTGLSPASISLFLHGSTIATNALITGSGARTGLITTEGFRDILEIRRIDRPDEDIYNVFWEKPKPLVPRHLRMEVSARMRFDGTEAMPLVEGEVLERARVLQQLGVEAIAVCLLHSYANPAHEIAIGESIQKHFPSMWISLSHEVAREIREYERTSSTAIDAFVKKPVVSYLERLETTLADSVSIPMPPLIANSSGGVSTVKSISNAPIQMMESGPAGGAIGAQFLSSVLDAPNIVTGDVGGTSYDVSLVIGGSTQIRSEHDIMGYAARVPSIDVRSVGAGGGSIAAVDPGGRLHVGPASAGADPGPMCFGKGGTEPTVTDAALLTGLIDPERFAGGEMRLDVSASSTGIHRVADRLGLSDEETAEGMLTLARNNMANVTRQILVGQGHDPRDFILLSFGGGGGLFAVEVARTLDIPEVTIPAHPAMFSAWGMLSADIVGTFARSFLRTFDVIEPDHVGALYAGMEADADLLLSEAGINQGDRVLERVVDARYAGQGHEVEVPLGEIEFNESFVERLSKQFDLVHESRYGHQMSSERESVTFRLRAYGRLGRLELPVLPRTSDLEAVPSGYRRTYMQGDWQDTPVFQRDALRPGHDVDGPALIEEPSHVTVLTGSDRLTVDQHGFLRIAIGS